MAPKPQNRPWNSLRGKIALEVLVAPRTGGDPCNQGNWPDVPAKVVNYLENNVLEKPWRDVISLLAAIMVARRFEVSSVLSRIVTLHCRFTSLFECLRLSRMRDWDVTTHIPLYLKAEILPQDPQTVRQRFWVSYNSASKTMSQWLGRMSGPQRDIYQPFTLPLLSRLFVEGLTRGKEVTEQQQRNRKSETDAAESKDQSPRIRYILRLVPKGEKTNTPKDYFIGQQTKRLLVRVAQMLGEHYQLQPGQLLPSVRFSTGSGRAHRFENAPYLFQYASHHLSDNTISSCMRFLLHGMVFKTRDGKAVVLKSHLLRHAFATHAVQVEKIPIDVVGAWLHQKDLVITDYYSKPTESMIAEAADVYLARLATQIDVGKAILRSPKELQHAYESARGKAGTLADVIGGQCISHGYCAAKFACVGCAGKAPDPAKRNQIERHKEWALLQVGYATTEGLYPESERMKQLVRDCDAELAEMDLIESYCKDECREVGVQIELPK